MHVVTADVTDLASLKASALRCRHVCDTESPSFCQAAAKEVAAVTGGKLDYLINNAAYIQAKRSEYTLDA